MAQQGVSVSVSGGRPQRYDASGHRKRERQNFPAGFRAASMPRTHMSVTKAVHVRWPRLSYFVLVLLLQKVSSNIIYIRPLVTPTFVYFNKTITMPPTTNLPRVKSTTGLPSTELPIAAPTHRLTTHGTSDYPSLKPTLIAVPVSFKPTPVDSEEPTLEFSHAPSWAPSLQPIVSDAPSSRPVSLHRMLSWSQNNKVVPTSNINTEASVNISPFLQILSTNNPTHVPLILQTRQPTAPAPFISHTPGPIESKPKQTPGPSVPPTPRSLSGSGPRPGLPSLAPTKNVSNIFYRTTEPVGVPEKSGAPVGTSGAPKTTGAPIKTGAPVSVGATSKPRFVNVTIPIDFYADLLLNNATGTFDGVAQVWEIYLLDYFRGVFAGRQDVRVLGVDLTVRQHQRMLQRRLMDYAVTVESVGGTDFAVDEASLGPDQFKERANRELQTALSANSLQSALRRSATQGGTTVSRISKGGTSTRSVSSSKPTSAEIVIGFTLMIATMGSLVFWARVLWEKRQKRVCRRKLESLRKQQSVTIESHRAIIVPTKVFSPTQQSIPVNTVNSEGSISSGYPGIATMTGHDDEEEIYHDASDDASSVSDQFARELKLAASFDRAAWDENQRHKKYMELERLSEGSSVVGASETVAVGVAKKSHLTMYNSPGSDDVGMEVELRSGGFPYGDEQFDSSTSPVQLTSENAVEWTEAGISLTGVTNRGLDANNSAEEDTFSPYGDGKGRKGRSLEESWDLDEFPVKDESGPSQFSFLHPLKKRDFDAEVPDARRSADSEESVCESFEVTSLGTPEFFDSNVREANYGCGDNEDSESKGEAALTASMIKELEEIAQYVKQYEQLRDAKKSAQHEHKLISNNKRLIGVSKTSKAIRNLQHEALDDSFNNRRTTGYRSVVLGREKDGALPIVPSARDAVGIGLLVVSPSDGSSQVTSDADDDTSQRLGISRISVDKPPAPMLSYKSSQDETLQYDPSSPIPSSDFDSLRYSPTQSFEKQITSNFHDKSLLDYARTLTDESDDMSKQYKLSDLRSSPNMLDAAPSDENTQAVTDAYITISRDRKRGFLRGISLRRNERTPEVYIERKVSPRVRSKDWNFNNIRTMFESKHTTPIVPPNESVRFC